MFEHFLPKDTEAAPVSKWTTALTTRPTSGATPPSQLYGTWHASHHHQAKKAAARARAAIPKLVPDLSEGVAPGKYDDLL